MTIPAKEEFLQHVEKHTMTVLMNEGLHRHLRFKRPDTSDQSFDLITWPGYLLITGDMGSYLFQRLTDMFEFFRGCPSTRTDRGSINPSDLKINPGYWGEKLQAIDKCSGYRAWDKEKFKQAILNEFNQWVENNQNIDKEIMADAHTQFYEDILQPLDDWTRDEAYRAVTDFEVDGWHLFQDFWEADTDEYTYHYLWCCHAIVWGIEQFDSFLKEFGE